MLEREDRRFAEEQPEILGQRAGDAVPARLPASLRLQSMDGGL